MINRTRRPWSGKATSGLRRKLADGAYKLAAGEASKAGFTPKSP
jgi:hypothetical protein